MWRDLFDRALWVPLRNLKRDERRRSPTYNFGSLLNDEYFSQHPKGKDLAKALWRTLEITRSERTELLLLISTLRPLGSRSAYQDKSRSVSANGVLPRSQLTPDLRKMFAQPEHSSCGHHAHGAVSPDAQTRPSSRCSDR
ncbi:hypothetical protein BJX63DRAFT_62506 [Aspergillus granulosus]|uniref:Uncharacterized protein n=1 Tax=Aspergillus granulosus TaxID=176169 RepID=A0ABR4GWV7_9EURO